ncbi:hypothetical protein DPSP01_014218 [Paraphaeosphaeria sporulosa]|uniref:Uncharacterized protein n=1 Tax=Paraphaeosphaeria sporulosa TaxID=1460663 RepID=A0A177BUZ4_9PLEO|nr:uncharacterized protein CC84DRAFT_1130963 [Paraphaeosphaeria sporulosa]OAF99212.1 hypothetical protein CC84DRAFT_1130963 [Paraphaeosphaeria sporulosa]
MAGEKPAQSIATPALQPPFAPRPIPPKPAATVTTSHASLLNGAADYGQQPVLDSATNIPLTDLESLPTLTGDPYEPFLANEDIKKFLAIDLDLKRLNRIHGHLWMCGRPMRARALHRYKMLGMEALPTTQMDLHLLRFSNKLMIKPLGEYMLSYSFWLDHLCDKEELHKAACGFLLSYIWLLTTPLDLKLAHELFLIPSFVTWNWWKSFVADFTKVIDVRALDQVNKRFHFGDLRLGRINSVYRIRYAHTHFVRGYLYGYNRYVVFFQRKFSWILVVFVFFSLVLAAMQVGASVDPLQQNHEFLKSCYGFVVFSMVSVAAVLGVIGGLFFFIFFFNMVTAIGQAKRWEIKRMKMAEERRLKQA